MLEKCEVSSAAANAQRFADYSKRCGGVILPPPVCESHVILTELRRLAYLPLRYHGSIPSGRIMRPIDDYKRPPR